MTSALAFKLRNSKLVKMQKSEIYIPRPRQNTVQHAKEGDLDGIISAFRQRHYSSKAS